MGGNDTPDRYEFPYKDNKLIATRHDPYGFWRITLSNGPTPKELQGDFSSNRYASLAIKSYIDKKVT